MPTRKKKLTSDQSWKDNFQEIIDGIVDPFYIIDVNNFDIAFANKAAKKTGILTQVQCHKITHNSDRPCFQSGLACPIEIIKRTKKPTKVEHVHNDADGNDSYYEINAYPLLDENGEVKQIIEHTINVTEHKKIIKAIQNSEKRYRALYESSRDGFALVDMQGNIQQFNQAFQDMLGYSEQELIDLTYFDLTPKKWHKKESQLIAKEVIPNGYSPVYEKEYIHKVGTILPVELRTYLIKNSEDKPTGMWAFVRDISARKEAENKLRTLQETVKWEKRKLEHVLNIDRKMSSILNLNHLVDFVIDKATHILEVERCSLMLLDPKSQELTIRGAKGLATNYITKTRIRMGEGISGKVAQDGTSLIVNNIEEEEGINRKNRNGYRTRSFMSVPIQLQNKLVGVVNVADKKLAEDPTFNEIDLRILNTIVRQAAISIENATYYRELEYLTISDPLTGIYNYRYFIKQLDKEINRAQRYNHALALLMIDIDNFKSYNDKFGHLEGDLLLKKVSKGLGLHLRSVDVVCRYAGDEFVGILPETGIKKAEHVAEKIRDAIKQLHCKQQVSISIGVAELGTSQDRRDLILKTDQALYQAKRDGKGKICCFR